MDKVKTFSKIAHDVADHILILREKAEAKELDTMENYIFLAKNVFRKIEDGVPVVGATSESHRKLVLFISVADFALSAVHRLLGGSDTPEELADRITDLYCRKNADYGDAFARSLNKYGIVAALVRVNDKINRLCSLTAPGREAQVKDESILDTLLDLASYAIMAVMWMTEAQDEALKQIIQNGPYTI